MPESLPALVLALVPSVPHAVGPDHVVAATKVCGTAPVVPAVV